MAKFLFIGFNRISLELKKGNMNMQIAPITPISNRNIHSHNNSIESKRVTEPSFTGFNFFKKSPKYVKFDSDITVFSPKELRKLRENVAREINEIVSMPATPALKKRLNDLLRSPFADYSTNFFGNNCSNLSDLIILSLTPGKGTETYRQFILTSLSETIPTEVLKDKSFKTIAGWHGNEPLKYILESYPKMNENSPEAVAIRKMLKRFKEADIPVVNKEFYLADSVVNNQPIMSKTYIDLFGITPNDSVRVLSTKTTRTTNYFDMIYERFGKPKIIDNPVTNTKFFIANPDKAKYSDGFYFNYENVSEPMSLYKLCGLSENEEIRNIFDVIPFMKNNLHEYRPRNEKACEQVNEFEHFLIGAQDYHPELASLDFIEKYIKSYDLNEHNVSAILRDYPLVRYNEKLVNELEVKIKLLAQNPTEENKKELDLLTNIYDYVKR